MRNSTNKSFFATFMLASFFLVALSSCGLFKKKCDCPTWSKAPVQRSIQSENAQIV